MIIHTFFDKCNTIIKDSENNLGLNPVAELNTGDVISRIILHFDLTELKAKVQCGEIQTANLRHIIKMTNCGNITLPLFNNTILSEGKTKKRAASFDIIAFRIPYEWDAGYGFDYNEDYVKETHRITSSDCCNWFQARNDMQWDEDGIYSNETLAQDYLNNFGISDDSIVISRQHFNKGTENIELDVTNFINQILQEDIAFNGIGLAFSPRFESENKDSRFISFFTNNTNTFFAPFLETIDDNTILDNRANFHLGVNNRLYFFVSDAGRYINLDVLPTCTIDNVLYKVKHGGLGAYYVELNLKKGEVEPNTILYDTWSNIILDGEQLDDVEMEFVVLPMEQRISIGSHKNNNLQYTPQLSGINFKEKVKKGDTKEITVDFIEDYSHGKRIIPTESEYRVYVKENDREIDILQYQPIERRYDEHIILINTNELIPNDYHIDIKTKQGRTVKIFDNVLQFSIVSNVTSFYK
jgi:hypothetical protein